MKLCWGGYEPGSNINLVRRAKIFSIILRAQIRKHRRFLNCFQSKALYAAGCTCDGGGEWQQASVGCNTAHHGRERNGEREETEQEKATEMRERVGEGLLRHSDSERRVAPAGWCVLFV